MNANAAPAGATGPGNAGAGASAPVASNAPVVPNSNAAENRVRVCVRSRPPQPSEMRGRKVVQTHRDRVTVGEKVYQFDQVFEDSAEQDMIFEGCVENLVEGCFEGFNATVFAYGQTGSGKTHSMVGSGVNDEDGGIIPRALHHLFTRLQQQKDDVPGLLSVLALKVSFLEIYNDEVRDLLHPEVASREIMIREDREGRIFFTGARDEPIGSVEEGLYLLEVGTRQRTTGETFMNAASSRSHVSVCNCMISVSDVFVDVPEFFLFCVVGSRLLSVFSIRPSSQYPWNYSPSMLNCGMQLVPAMPARVPLCSPSCISSISLALSERSELWPQECDSKRV